MEKIIFFGLVIPILGFVLYLGATAIMKGFSAKSANKVNGNSENEKNDKKNNKDFCRIVISSLKNTLSFFICLMEKLKGDINSNY